MSRTDRVRAVACTVVDGRPVAVTGDAVGTVQVWDLATSERRATPRDSAPSRVFALACDTVAGDPFVIAAGKEGIKVWGLGTSTAHPHLSALGSEGNPSGSVWVGLRFLARDMRDRAINVKAVACTS